MSVLKGILARLEQEGLEYEHLMHEHVHTSKDAAKVRGTLLEQAAKALVLKEGHTGQFFMFIVAGDRRVDLALVKKDILGVKNIALASPEEVFKLTGCSVGSVPPFGPLFGIKTYFDQHLLDTQEDIVFSAGTHHDSIKMRTRDFLSIVACEVRMYSTSTRKEPSP